LIEVIKDSIRIVQEKFADYYRENSALIPLPSEFRRREFGFLMFKGGVMVRHKGFSEPTEIRRFMETITPSDIYYSSAYYEKPEETMERKGWLGADLIFDIDADHIPTQCKAQHDLWRCQACGATGVGAKPEKCPQCGWNKFEDETWPCKNCLEAAKSEALKLLDFLIRDFGFSNEEVEVCFSGQRGYHVHVESEVARSLDQLARKEITDYLLGVGLDLEMHGVYDRGSARVHEVAGPAVHDLGWRGRLARGVFEFITESNAEQFEAIGVRRETADKILSHREILIRLQGKMPPWRAFSRIGTEVWQGIVKHAIKKETVAIDTVVTTDIHRLIRMPETLHGKTGLKKTRIGADRLKDFDPLRDAVAFKSGTMTIHVNEAQQIRLGEQVYGPYRNETVRLPTAVAVFLLCKRVATPVE
jgi:DNA primase small subunit